MQPDDMRPWRERWSDRCRTATEAVGRVRAGQRVFVGSGAGQPQALVEALAARTDLNDTEIVHILTLGVAPYAESRLGSRFRTNAFFIGPNVRDAVGEGRADYTPIFLSELPALFRSGRTGIDVALISVSPPDAHGYCSLGVSTDVVKAAVESARLVVAEVNARMPRALGDCFVHARALDVLVESDRALPELAPPVLNDVARGIGRHVATLVEDGATLQLGIGSIPDAVLAQLEGFRDLGVHTEMFSDGLLPLIERGVVTGARKSLHRSKVVASFVMGSRRLYDFVHDNPLIEFHPSEYVNDPFVIAQNDKMVAVNGAIEVDLTGQVCADSMGRRFYSGIGGQVDFIRGAARSRGGKPVIALPSTAEEGTVSRIVPMLRPGAGVVTSRGDVHYVVTEYGVAYLHGRTVRERALALIEIAHPKFRPWLLAEAKAQRLVYADQIERPIHALYPEGLERWVELKDGRRAFLRPLKLTDEGLVRDLFYRLSPESVHYRFFRLLKAMPHRQLQELLRVDYAADMALVALTGIEPEAEMVGIAHYAKDPNGSFAETAFLVRDDWHGKGVATALMATLAEHAQRQGIAGFTAEVLASNHGMLRVFHKGGWPVQSTLASGVYSLRIPFA